MIKILVFIIIMGALVGFLWHDEFNVWVGSWQKQAAEKAPGLINQGLGQAEGWWDKYGEAWADQLVARLTSEGKVKIDAWLAGEGLNEFGDKISTVYTGGTPLFNEATGQSIERYAYILKKFPDLISQLKLEQYLK